MADAPPAPTHIDVWIVPWTQYTGHAATFRTWLSAHEEARAESFRFERDRQLYLVTHGAMRSILASHLHADPAAVPIIQGDWQKPQLDESCGSALQFNLSHSGELALVAVSTGPAVGVDIEEIQSRFDLSALAERFFSPAEDLAFDALPDAERQDAFFRLWTRKEAFLKARGNGLSLGLDQFDIALAAECDNALLATTFDPAEAARWRIVPLSIAPSYAAALAAAGHDWTVTIRAWTGP